MAWSRHVWVLSHSLLLSQSALLVGYGTVAAQQTPPAVSVDSVFAQWDRAGSPGCAVGVIKGGRTLHAKGYGYANLDWDVPITPSTTFYMASLSKQFTAATVVLLARDGRLLLDDAVRKYVPELPTYADPITIRHLIHHTSGLRDIFELLENAGISPADVHSEKQILDLIIGSPSLNFAPGDEHRYSNSGYLLLGIIVRRVSGRSLREFAQERVFAPLGMARTHFHDDAQEVVKHRAMSYGAAAEGRFIQTYLGNNNIVGPGGLYTSVQDFLLWDRNFSEAKVGGPGFSDLLLTPGVLNPGGKTDYAFGLRVGEYRGRPAVHHDGNNMGFKHYYLRIPEERLSVICLCNLRTIDARDLTQRVADLYLGGH